MVARARRRQVVGRSPLDLDGQGIEPRGTADRAVPGSGVGGARDRRVVRLAQVPQDLYWADTFGQPDEHDHVLADARDFTAFVRGCASEQRGLLITLS